MTTDTEHDTGATETANAPGVAATPAAPLCDQAPEGIPPHQPGSLVTYCDGCTDPTPEPRPQSPGERVAALAGTLQAIMTFFLEHPDLPAPSGITLTVDAASRAELDGWAGDFGQAPPRPARNYDGAQFSTSVPGAGRTSVLMSHWNGDL